MYKVLFKKPVLKFLSQHKWQKIVSELYKNIEELRKNPFNERLNVIKLQWYEYRYRLRIWKFRFLYRISENTITLTFYDAGSRGDIYK